MNKDDVLLAAVEAIAAELQVDQAQRVCAALARAVAMPTPPADPDDDAKAASALARLLSFSTPYPGQAFAKKRL